VEGKHETEVVQGFWRFPENIHIYNFEVICDQKGITVKITHYFEK